MKSRIKFNDLELIVESKNNKITSYMGSEVLKELVSKHFKKPITVLTPGSSKDFGDITEAKILRPGDKRYIQAVLIEVIQNELGLDVTYNI